MPRLEGNFSIHLSDEGLCVILPEPEGEKIFYITDSGDRYEVVKDVYYQSDTSYPKVTAAKRGGEWLRLVPIKEVK